MGETGEVRTRLGGCRERRRGRKRLTRQQVTEKWMGPVCKTRVTKHEDKTGRSVKVSKPPRPRTPCLQSTTSPWKPSCPSSYLVLLTLPPSLLNPLTPSPLLSNLPPPSSPCKLSPSCDTARHSQPPHAYGQAHLSEVERRQAVMVDRNKVRLLLHELADDVQRAFCSQSQRCRYGTRVLSAPLLPSLLDSAPPSLSPPLPP
eukprot:749086-Hanusia_phi.AAC.1